MTVQNQTSAEEQEANSFESRNKIEIDLEHLVSTPRGMCSRKLKLTIVVDSIPPGPALPC